MKVLDWIKIIMMVLELIIGGMEKKDAVEKTASFFNVSAKSIRKHGGF